MNEYLKFCRYYKGEKICPYKDGNAPFFWEYERIWVEDSMHHWSFYDVYIDDYEGAGLDDFSADDGVPLQLKALLYNRHLHFGGTSETFREVYLEDYLVNGRLE